MTTFEAATEFAATEFAERPVLPVLPVLPELSVLNAPASALSAPKPKPSPSANRLWLRRGALAVLAVVVGVEMVIAAPYIGEGASALTSSDVRWLVLAVALELISMRSFSRMRRTMLAAGGVRVPILRMERLTYTSNAMGSTFPGGPAVSSGYLFKRLLSWGASVPTAGFTVLTSTVLSVLAYATLAAGTAVAAGSGGGYGTGIAVAAVLAFVALAALWIRKSRPEVSAERLAERVLHGVNRVLRRAPDAGVERLRGLVADVRAIRPRHRDWAVGMGFAVLNWVADLACLIICCRAVGADQVSTLVVMVAYVAGMSLASVTLSPGGLGIIDAAMIFALTQAGETVVLATAAVLLYRLISFALVVSVGWVMWAGERIAARSGRALRSGAVATDG